MKLIRFIVFVVTIQLSLQGLSQQPLRIISLAPSLTKNIYFLSAQDQLVGCTSYCTEALNDQKQVVASAIKVNVEKTLSLLPDLVLVTTITSPETIELLTNLDLKVEVFASPKSFDEICDQFDRLGKLIGKSAMAQEIIANSQIKVKQLTKSIQKESHPQVMFQIGADPIFTVLPNTFMNDYITLTGGSNIAENLTKGTMTRESVLVRDPDFIFIVTMGITGTDEKEIWQSFSDIKATKENNIFIIDAEKACSPTPITFVETFETIVSLMNQN